MTPAPYPTNESERLQALRDYGVLDTPPEAEFDGITALAAQLCGTPIALISLVDERRQWFKSRIGLTETETSREIAFCSHAVLGTETFVVSNAEDDPRFADNPLVSGERHLRFYAGAPLVTPHGHALGTLCVFDRVPRRLTDEQMAGLRVLSRQVMTQLQLRSAAAQYRLLFAANPHPMWVYDVESLRILTANSAAISHYGYSESEFVGMNLRRLRPAEDRERFEELAGDGETKRHTGNWRHLKKDGTLIHVEITAESISFGGKRARLVLANDVTERVAAEREVARMNRALRLVSACNECLIRATEEPALLKAICSRVVEVGGYRMAWVGYAHDDDRRSVSIEASAGENTDYLGSMSLSWSATDPTGLGPTGTAIRTGRPFLCEDIAAESVVLSWRDAALARGFRSLMRLPLIDGGRAFGVLSLYSNEVKTVGEAELQLLRELADNLAFGIGSLRARVASRAAAARLAEQAALLDHARDAIVVRDLSHRITFWNESAARIYGWSAAEAVGRIMPELVATEASLLDAAVRRLLQEGEWVGELHRRTKAGAAIVTDCRWTLVRNDAGAPSSVLCIETDITERRKLEQQFLRGQRLESLGTLAGGIAHDLNNLLAPIMMGVGLLRMQGPESERMLVIENIERSARRGADLVKQVLSFARGVEGSRVSVDLSQIVREIDWIARKTFPKNITTEVRIPDELDFVTGDPTQLNQVFLNLCLNARDAMPEGGHLSMVAGNVEIDESLAVMHRGAAVGRYVKIQVGDTGIGMSEEVMERIFEPFFTTKEVGKGTGLGLSTALGIVRSHGGFMQVSSEPGRGSAFRVFLPSRREGRVEKAAGPGAAAAPRGSGETILIVDDETPILSVTRQTLEAFGYRVLCAEDGAQAIGLYALHRSEIAVVLTDMMMPVMDGPALIAALRRIDPKVRVIAASGLSSNGNVARAANAGVDHFLPKPYSAETMLEVIRSVLTSR